MLSMVELASLDEAGIDQLARDTLSPTRETAAEVIAQPLTKAQVIERVLDGMCDGRSVNEICKEPGMPPKRTVRRWIVDDEHAAAAYARAREIQADNFADMLVEIALACTEKEAKSAAVKVDALKWRVAKLHPAVYGERIEARLSTDVGLAAVLTQLSGTVRACRQAALAESQASQPIDITPDTVSG